MDLERLLKNVDFFAGVDEEHLKKIEYISTVRQFQRGEVIFEEGSVGTEFYVVGAGTVAVNKNVAGGRKRNLSNLGAGQVFGELALFDAEPRSADAEAVEDSEIIVLPNEEFKALLKDNPSLADIIHTRVIRILCKRLRDTDDMLKEGVIWGFSMEL